MIEKEERRREIQTSFLDPRSSVSQNSLGTKKEGFHQISKGGNFGKSIFSGLGGVLETSFGSTTLQEVGTLPTLVYFPL